MILIVVIGTVADVLWLLPTHLAALPQTATTTGFSVLLALVAYRVLVRNRHVPADVLIFAILAGIDVWARIGVGGDAETAQMINDYMLLMPPVVALLIPWNTGIHVAWLTVHGVLVVLPGLISSAAGPSLAGPSALIGVLLVSSAVSVVGHILNLRRRVTSYALIQQVRSMNRDMRRRDARLTALNGELERAAVTDQLTGLGNRVALRRQLELAWNRVDRHGDRYAILMFDLDHFKAINDTFGHFAGDAVLRRVAEAVARTVRASDGTYRFGGEEFLAVVRLEGDDDAAAGGERIRAAVEQLGIAHPGNPPYGVVTVSVGGTIVDRSRLGETADAWLHRADLALYEAKRTGRNRSVIA